MNNKLLFYTSVFDSFINRKTKNYIASIMNTNTISNSNLNLELAKNTKPHTKLNTKLNTNIYYKLVPEYSIFNRICQIFYNYNVPNVALISVSGTSAINTKSITNC
jgi:hypothetical protein